MTCPRKTIGRLAIISVLGGMTAALAVRAEEDSSLLVEPSDNQTEQGPALTSPANGPPLPPPERPSSLPAESSQRATNQPAPKQPFLRPAEPKPSTTFQVDSHRPIEAIPLPPESAPFAGVAVRPSPPIKYDTDRKARRMYAKHGTVEVVMVTKNPADGCYYEIPMCIPTCCLDEPNVSGGRGILGRGVVEYCWPCGFTAKVKFRHVLGDVKVEYDG